MARGTPVQDAWLGWAIESDFTGCTVHEWTPAGAAFTVEAAGTQGLGRAIAGTDCESTRFCRCSHVGLEGLECQYFVRDS